MKCYERTQIKFTAAYATWKTYFRLSTSISLFSFQITVQRNLPFISPPPKWNKKRFVIKKNSKHFKLPRVFLFFFVSSFNSKEMSTTELVRRKRNVRRNQDRIDKLNDISKCTFTHTHTHSSSGSWDIRHEKLFRKCRDDDDDDDGDDHERKSKRDKKKEKGKRRRSEALILPLHNTLNNLKNELDSLRLCFLLFLPSCVRLNILMILQHTWWCWHSFYA